jgi:hypothetical protein
LTSEVDTDTAAVDVDEDVDDGGVGCNRECARDCAIGAVLVVTALLLLLI